MWYAIKENREKKERRVLDQKVLNKTSRARRISFSSFVVWGTRYIYRPSLDLSHLCLCHPRLPREPLGEIRIWRRWLKWRKLVWSRDDARNLSHLIRKRVQRARENEKKYVSKKHENDKKRLKQRNHEDEKNLLVGWRRCSPLFRVRRTWWTGTSYICSK